MVTLLLKTTMLLVQGNPAASVSTMLLNNHAAGDNAGKCKAAADLIRITRFCIIIEYILCISYLLRLLLSCSTSIVNRLGLIKSIKGVPRVRV